MDNFKFQSSVSPKMHILITDKLREIEVQENVRILFAIESGSRAWGFPSPDSDYDVRYIYVRRVDWYLSIQPGRDVLEYPIDAVFDINGWDIKKALGLLLKANPVMLEWLSSPIHYIWNQDVCTKLLNFAQETTYGSACLHHYLSLGSRQWNVYVEGRDEINLKKYFYIVRPAMAIKWLRLYPDKIPPMNFFALLEGINLDKDLRTALNDLLIRKSVSKEMGLAPRVPIIDDFIQQEFLWANEAVKNVQSTNRKFTPQADDLFREIVKFY